MLSDLLKVTQENESQSPRGAPPKEGRTPSPTAMQLQAQSPRRGPGLGGTIPEQRPSHAAARCHPCRGRPSPEAPHGPSCGAHTGKRLRPLGMRDPERWSTSWHRRGDTAEGVWPRVGVWNLKPSSAGSREALGLGGRGGATAEPPSSKTRGALLGELAFSSGASWGSPEAGDRCPGQLAARGAPSPGLGVSEHPSASRPPPRGRGAGRTLSRPLCLGADSRVCWCLRGRRGSRPLQLGSDSSVLCTVHQGERSRQLGTRAKSTSTGERPYKGPLNWFPERCCRMEGLELAASPSFLQTTCGEEGGLL